MVRKKIYIAGAMRGIPHYNFPAFYEAERVLRAIGWWTINPARVDEEWGFNRLTPEDSITRQKRDYFIKRDIDLVMSADALCILPGWEKSKGVAVEIAVANYCNIPIYTFNGALKVEA